MAGRVTQAPVEVLYAGSPNVRVSQAVAEALYAVSGYQAVATAQASGASSLTVPVPSPCLSGWFMLASLATGGPTVASAPSGWTLVAGSVTPNGNARLYTYWKLSTGAEPASYTWTFSGSGGLGGIMATHANIDPTAPILEVQTASYTAATTFDAPDLISDDSGEEVTVIAIDATAGTILDVTGDMVKVADTGGNQSGVGIRHKLRGHGGQRGWNLSGGRQATVQEILLRNLAPDPFTGSAAPSLPPLAVAAEGELALSAVSGTADMALAPLSVEATGTLGATPEPEPSSPTAGWVPLGDARLERPSPLVGRGAVELRPITARGVGRLRLRGTADVTLAAPSVRALGRADADPPAVEAWLLGLLEDDELLAGVR